MADETTVAAPETAPQPQANPPADGASSQPSQPDPAIATPPGEPSGENDNPLAPYLKDGKLLGRFDADPAKALPEVLKSYTELEKKLSSGQHAQPRGEDGRFQPKPTFIESIQSLELDPAAMAATFKEKRELPKEHYDKIAQAIANGGSRQFIDWALSRDVAATELESKHFEMKAAEFVGGPERLSKLLEFGASKLPDDRRGRIEKMLQDPAQYQDALTLLAVEHDKANGATTPSLRIGGGMIEADTAAPVMGEPFSTIHEALSMKAEIERKGGDPMKNPEFRRRWDATPKSVRTQQPY